MMLNRYFHGTNSENAISILRHGFINPFKNWDLSEDNMIYFWNVTNDRTAEECMDEAYRSACKSSAIKNSQSIDTVIIEICGDIPVREDESCDISEWERRVCIPTSELNEVIKNKHVTIRIHRKRYKPELRACYLYPIYHNCGGTRWESIYDHLVDREPLIEELRRLEKIYKYEHWFTEIYE